MNRLLVFILSTLSLLYFNPARATSVMGSEIVYKCIGNGQYTVIVRAYRDCNSTPLGQSNLVARCSSYTETVSNQTLVSVKDVTNLDPGCAQKSRCSGGTNSYGIEELTWTMTLDLSNYSCCEWILSWEKCCRNNNITTGQSSQNFFTNAMLNKCVASCNSSPVFLNAHTPVAIICHNQYIVFKNAATDTIDTGDSLSYELVSAMTGNNSSASYSGNFSPVRPLTFLGFPNQNIAFPAGFHLDGATGDMAFRPTQLNQVATVVIQVKEWRKINGTMELIGYTKRELQIIVISCSTNKAPIIKSPYAYKVCAGNQICIPIVVKDTNANDSVQISWNNTLPGASFTMIKMDPGSSEGQICWTPTANDVDTIPHSFIVTANDNGCPHPDTATQRFDIRVVSQNSAPLASLDIRLLSCLKVAIDFTPQSSYPGLTFKYTIRDTTDSTVWTSYVKQDTNVLNPGKYYIDLWMDADNLCPDVISDSFTVTGIGPIRKSSQIKICQGEMITLNPNYVVNGSQVIFDWYNMNSSGQSTFITTSSQLSVTPTSKTKYIAYSAVGNCEILDTTAVIWNPKPQVSIGINTDTVCERSAVFNLNDASSISNGAITQWGWTFGDGQSSNTKNPTHTYSSSGNYLIQLIAISDSACKDTAYQSVSVLPAPTLTPLQHQLNLVIGSNAQFSVGAVFPSAMFQWQQDTGQGFYSLSNGGQYSGVNTSALTVSNVQAYNHNSIFRCIVYVSNCSDTSNSAVLSIVLGIGPDPDLNSDALLIYPNPAKNSITLKRFDTSTPGLITIINVQGSIILTLQMTHQTEEIDISSFQPGLYFLIDKNSNKKIPFVKD